MKPTVIASGGSENPSSHHPAGTSVNPAGHMGPSGEGSGAAPSNSPNSRQFPHFQTGFGFDPDDDLFDAGLRSRLNRFRDPFSFARKRCGNSENSDDPYSRYFDDDSDFFPNFGSFPGRRRAPSQNASNANPSPFFDHIPAEFRHYIPDGFGFPNVRNTGAPPPHPQYQQQAHPQQYYEAYLQPSSPTAQPPQQRPKLCDAAIQTEDLDETDGSKEAKHLKNYGMRNTVDLGQKSPPEECRGPRSHSAPPPDNGDQNVPQAQKLPNANEAHVADSQNQAGGTQYTTQGTQPMTPQYQTWQEHQKQQHQQQPQPQQQQPQPQQQQPPQQTQATSPGGGFMRTVPIFVEGRSDPIISKKVIPPQQQAPRQPQPKQKPGHPTPLNTQQPTPATNQIPPQTPHTAECISKIQAIQRDVLDLMMKVEHFQGMRGDKEYMYLDEMLTRNLLKLDTIDTNGKDSIRLARREAIKCIQASINVLEAKSEENAKTAQPPEEQAVIEGSTEESKIAEESKAEEVASDVKGVENEAASLPPENVAIPLPPPPIKESENEPKAELNKVEESLIEKAKPEEGDQIKEETQCNTDQKTVKPEEKENPMAKEQLPEKPAEKEKSTEKEEKPIAAEQETKSTDIKDLQAPLKAEPPPTQKKPESGNESESSKPVNTGAVKKKIVKKKKAPTESTSPPENPTPETTQGAPEVEKTEQKSEQDPNQP